MSNLFTILGTAHSGWRGAQHFFTIWAPVAPIPDMVAPLLAIVSVLTVALLSGIAIGALSTLLIALAALHIILTQVLGLSIEINI